VNGYSVVAARIEQEMADLDRVISRAEELWAKSQQSGDDGYLDGVALNLHGFYAGAERIFEEIARSVDEAVPAGSDWHRVLLVQMSAAIDDVRPAVIRQNTRFCLDEYRGFRHVVRNVYTFNLRPSRLQELIANLRACHESLLKDLADFVHFLKQLDQPKP
jgi:hypothetical protein